MDVGPFTGAWFEPDAGLLMILLHGPRNYASLILSEGAGNHVGDGGTRPLSPLISDRVPALRRGSQVINHHVLDVAFE